MMNSWEKRLVVLGRYFANKYCMASIARLADIGVQVDDIQSRFLLELFKAIYSGIEGCLLSYSLHDGPLV